MQLGKLRLIDCQYNSGEGNHFYVFIYDDGSFVENVDNKANAPINEHVEVAFNGDKLIWWDWANTALADKGVMVKDIALVKVVSAGYLSEDAQKAVERAARELEHFLIQTNDDLWTEITVTPYLIENIEGQTLGLYSFDFDVVKDRMREQHPDKVDHHNYFHGWGGGSSGLRGLAFVGGHKAWTWNSGNQRTIYHETGHNLGSRHSSSPGNDYGHIACIMGRAYTGFCAPQLVLLGQIRQDNIKYVTDEDGCYFLCPLEVSRKDLRGGEHKAIFLNAKEGHKNYMLSTRKTKDQSVVGGANEEGNIYVEEVLATFNNEPLYLFTLSPGELEEIGGHVVYNDGVKEGVVQVLVGEADGQPYPEPLELPAGEDIDGDLSGVWNNPDYLYQGLEVFVKDDGTIFGFWFSHHAEGKHRIDSLREHNGKEFFTFYGSVGQTDNIADVDIYSVHNREEKLEGSGTLRFDGESLNFRFYTEIYGRDSLRLYRLTDLRQPPSGIWKSGELEGYTVAKYNYEASDFYVVYHYFHSIHGNVDWNVYTGFDRESLQGVSPHTKYKANFVERLDSAGTIDIDWVINNHEPVYVA